MTWRKRSAQARVSEVYSVRAPLGGLNDIDPLAMMPEGDCVSLVNWYPGTGALESRSGYSEWCTGLTGAVKTVIEYIDMGGDVLVFAATSTGIYDVTLSSAAPPLVYSESLGTGRLSTVMFGNVGFQYLIVATAGGGGR